MVSYWQRDVWNRYDFIVVGAGIIGLSTAISLKELHPSRSVVVIEQGFMPNGASVRNAGFACFGSLTEILHDIGINGEEATVKVVRARYAGLQLLRKRLGDEACAYEEHGGYELLFEHNLSALDHRQRINALLADIFPAPVFHECNHHISEFGFDTTRVKALVRSDFEGQIHSGIMMRSLAALAQERGVVLLWGAEVQRVESNSAEARLTLQHGEESLTIGGTQVAVCTNAAIGRLLGEHLGNDASDISITPARGQVMITSPIASLPFRGTFHFDEGFYYFRNVSSTEGQRILMGGGRNLDFDTERTSILALNTTIQQELERLLREMIAPGYDFSIQERWAGIMGFHQSKLPVVRRVGERLVIGFGCNGMGVALGSTIGEETARCLVGEGDE